MSDKLFSTFTSLVPQCNQVISSDGGRNGSFSTPNFPNPYPPKAHCRFEFIGHGRERVHIVFVDFDLFHHSEAINFNIPPAEGEDDGDEGESGNGGGRVEDQNGQQQQRSSSSKKKFSDSTSTNPDYGRKGAERRRRKGAIKDSDKIFKQLSKEAVAPGGNSERK